MTALFNPSYENLMPERRRAPNLDRHLLGPIIGENHPKTGNVDYLPAKSLGSHASVLVAMLSGGKVHLSNPADAAARRSPGGQTQRDSSVRRGTPPHHHLD